MALYPEITKIYYEDNRVDDIGTFPEKTTQNDTEEFIYKRNSIYGNLDVDVLMKQSPGIRASAKKIMLKCLNRQSS